MAFDWSKPFVSKSWGDRTIQIITIEVIKTGFVARLDEFVPGDGIEGLVIVGRSTRSIGNSREMVIADEVILRRDLSRVQIEDPCYR